MRLVSIDSVRSNDRITYPILSTKGKKFLSENAELTDNYIKRLKEMGIKHLFIEDKELSDIKVEHVISPQIRSKAHSVYNKMKELIINGREVNSDEIKELSKQIVEDIVSVELPVHILDTLYPAGEKLASHAINTSILSAYMGIEYGYNFNKLCDLVLAGFIHDAGREIVSDNSDQKHIREGYEALRKGDRLSVLCVAVAYQHHEKYNGTGIPRGIKKSDITEYTRIISIADYFDEQLSRYSNKILAFKKVYDEVLNNSNVMFDPEMVKVFKEVIQIYPNGTKVTLNDGKKGIVFAQNKGKPLRPIIKLYNSKSSKYIEELDLSQQFNLDIKNIQLD